MKKGLSKIARLRKKAKDKKEETPPPVTSDTKIEPGNVFYYFTSENGTDDDQQNAKEQKATGNVFYYFTSENGTDDDKQNAKEQKATGNVFYYFTSENGTDNDEQNQKKKQRNNSIIHVPNKDADADADDDENDPGNDDENATGNDKQNQKKKQRNNSIIHPLNKDAEVKRTSEQNNDAKKMQPNYDNRSSIPTWFTVKDNNIGPRYKGIALEAIDKVNFEIKKIIKADYSHYQLVAKLSIEINGEPQTTVISFTHNSHFDPNFLLLEHIINTQESIQDVNLANRNILNNITKVSLVKIENLREKFSEKYPDQDYMHIIDGSVINQEQNTFVVKSHERYEFPLDMEVPRESFLKRIINKSITEKQLLSILYVLYLEVEKRYHFDKRFNDGDSSGRRPFLPVFICKLGFMIWVNPESYQLNPLIRIPTQCLLNRDAFQIRDSNEYNDMKKNRNIFNIDDPVKNLVNLYLDFIFTIFRKNDQERPSDKLIDLNNYNWVDSKKNCYI